MLLMLCFFNHIFQCHSQETESESDERIVCFLTEFDDLEMCTSLECGSQWWPASSNDKTTTQSCGYGNEASSLQHLVKDLRSQLSCSQGVISGLQSRLRSLSTSSEYGPSIPHKVNWSIQTSASQSQAEDNEGWQSSKGGQLRSPHHPDKDLERLASRVDALEDQLMKGGKKAAAEDGVSATLPG